MLFRSPFSLFFITGVNSDGDKGVHQRPGRLELSKRSGGTASDTEGYDDKNKDTSDNLTEPFHVSSVHDLSKRIR